MNMPAGTDHNESRTALGAELKTERERRGLSLHQASQELHIGDSILDALERGDYATLGAPIFVRGHLRAYARLLGLGEEAVLSRYEQEGDKPAPPPLVTQKLDNGLPRASTRIFSLLVVVVLCILTIAWWMHREPTPADKAASAITTPSNVAGTPASAPAATSMQPEQAAVVVPAEPVKPLATQPAEAVKHDIAAVPQHRASNNESKVSVPPLSAPSHVAATATRPATPAAASGADQTHVQFTLNQASWIEVYDASGKRLYYDLAPAGENVNVSGAGPLQVFLGNAPGVSIQLDGTRFDQTPYTRSDNTARFRLGGTSDKPDQAG